MNTPSAEENWEILRSCLPESWEEKACELGALRRKRKFASAETLLRVLLIHLATGKSLRSTAAYAHEAGLCDVNDAALLHRLKESDRWFRWMCNDLVEAIGSRAPAIAERFRVLLVDASIVSEPGSTGTDWRLHYCFELNTLGCEFFLITSPKVSETLEHYPAKEGDIVIGDRAYCQRKGICHILGQRAHVLVRFHCTNLPLLTATGGRWSVLDHLRELEEGEVGDWNVWFEDPLDGHLIKGRLCSLRKSNKAYELALQKLLREAKKKGRRVQEATIEHARYVTLFCTANRHLLTGKEVMELYRGRWQIELVFKRLKGIVGIGHLPKINEASCKAWLHGKMLVALLAERLHREAQLFSPWGYPIRSIRRHLSERSSQSMARV
jgi:hypothetical protein